MKRPFRARNFNGTVLLSTSIIAVLSIFASGAFAAAPTISNERVQLRTLANSDVTVNVGLTVEDLDGLAGVRVTVERPGVFGPFPLQRGLYGSPNDVCTPDILIPLDCTLDGYNVSIGTEFILPAQRAGNYVITVSDGGTPVSTTVTLPSGLTALAAGGPTFVDTSTGLLRPTISIPPIIGASGYRISITNDSDSTTETFDGVSGAGLASTPSIRVGSGRLEAGKFYRLSIDAFDGTTVAGSDVRSESDDICYDPATGATNIPCLTQKDVHLITEADGTAVMQAITRVLDSDDLAFLKNPPLTQPPTVPVTLTRGTFGPFPLTASIFRNVDIDSDVVDQFASARNPLDSNRIPVNERAGDYNVRAEDSTGNVVTVTRHFPAGLNPIPAPGPVTIDPSSGLFTPTFSIAPVPGATNYRVVVFNDTDSTRKNFDNLPGGTLSESPAIQLFPGILEPNKFYRFRMDAFNNETFSTSTVRSRTKSFVYDPSGLDTDGDGIQNLIDGQLVTGGFVDESAAASNSFTNQHLGGGVFGSVIDRADVHVLVVAAPDPASEVKLGGAGGSGAARINACLPTVDTVLTDSDTLIVNCLPLAVEVLDGPAEFLLGDDSVVIAPGGARLTIQEPSSGNYLVENSPTSFVPITLLLPGQEITLQPGSPGFSFIDANIDIKPGSFPNSINLGSQGNVPVAIFSSPSFDATTINPTTVTLASAPVRLKGKGKPMASSEDVNGDGLLDLVVHVDTSSLQLTNTSIDAVLEAQTTSGQLVVGKDSVRIVQ